MAEDKMYGSLEEWTADNDNYVQQVLADEALVREIKVGKKPLVDLMVNGLEDAVNKISGKTLDDDDRHFLFYRTLFQNNFYHRDRSDADAGLVQELLEKIYSSRKTDLESLSRDHVRKAFIIAVNDSKVPAILDKYNKNPHKEMTREQMKEASENKMKKTSELKREAKAAKMAVSNNKLAKISRFKKSLLVPIFVFAGFSAYMAFQNWTNNGKQEELQQASKIVEQKYGDINNDGDITEREKSKLYKDVARQNNVSFVNGSFKDGNGNIVPAEMVSEWLRDYRPSREFSEASENISKNFAKNKRLYETEGRKKLNNKIPILR